MSKPEAIEWLHEVEKYFHKRAGMSQEDSVIQAYRQNAVNARKIAKMLEDETSQTPTGQ